MSYEALKLAQRIKAITAEIIKLELERARLEAELSRLPDDVEIT